MAQNAAHRRAFTLVELLVVIGIITVLIALLIPALSKAWQQARSATCLSQLRQNGMALFEYAGSNRGAIPMAQITVEGATNDWYGVLEGLHGEIVYIPVHDIVTCPEMNATVPGTYGMYQTGNLAILTTFPGFIYYSFFNPATGHTTTFAGIRLSSLRQASDFMLLADTSSSVNFRQGCVEWKSGTSYVNAGEVGALWAPHMNLVNGVFADGHAESCDKGRLLGTSNYNGNTTPTNRPVGVSYWYNQDFTINNH